MEGWARTQNQTKHHLDWAGDGWEGNAWEGEASNIRETEEVRGRGEKERKFVQKGHFIDGDKTERNSSQPSLTHFSGFTGHLRPVWAGLWLAPHSPLHNRRPQKNTSQLMKTHGCTPESPKQFLCIFIVQNMLSRKGQLCCDIWRTSFEDYRPQNITYLLQ